MCGRPHRIRRCSAATGQGPGTPIESRRIGLEEHGLEQECDLLYLGVLSPELRQMMARRLGEAPVLTIEENNPECALGGIFCLGIRDSRVGFSVNLDSLARSGIRIHPAVLRLSRPRGE
nr:YfiR family protein [Zobellella denitrificans]